MLAGGSDGYAHVLTAQQLSLARTTCSIKSGKPCQRDADVAFWQMLCQENTQPILVNNIFIYWVKNVNFCTCAQENNRNLTVSVYTEWKTWATRHQAPKFFRFSKHFGSHRPNASRQKFQENCKSFSISLCTI